MALTATTLAAAIAASDIQFTLTSTSGFAAGQLVKIDNEYMVCVSIPVSGTIVVRARGFNGTPATAHGIYAVVVTSTTTSDFPTVSFGQVNEEPPAWPELIELGVTQTLPAWVSKRPLIFTLNNAAATAITLPTPSTALDGKMITFTSNTAYAHTVLGSSLIADAVSGSPHSTATFAAYKGASLTLMVSNGLYNIISSTGITVS